MKHSFCYLLKIKGFYHHNANERFGFNHHYLHNHHYFLLFHLINCIFVVVNPMNT